MVETKNLLSTEPSFLLERLIAQYQKQDQIIIAYDCAFDECTQHFTCIILLVFTAT